jgi:hypothetical protein
MESTEAKPNKSPPKTCFKCQAKAQLRYKSQLVVCGQCFSLQICLRGFRSVIRNQPDMFGTTNDLVVLFDGSVNSVMLAHIISLNATENEKAKKKVFFKAKFVLIDFSELAGKIFGNEVRAKVDSQNSLARKCLEHLKLDYQILPCSDFGETDSLAEKFKKLSIMGGYREDFIRILEMRFLVEHAIKAGKKKIVLPENGEQLAARSLKLLCKSRQNELVPQCSTAFILNRNCNLLSLVRPLSERSSREVYFYIKFNNVVQFSCDRYEWLSNDSTPRMFTMPGQGSINSLLVEFITDLQGEYLSTFSTILKTSERLKEITIADRPDLSECSFCWTVY